jgi:hypothetical protein
MRKNYAKKTTAQYVDISQIWSPCLNTPLLGDFSFSIWVDIYYIRTGINPTTVSYNATSSLVCFEEKKTIFY